MSPVQQRECERIFADEGLGMDVDDDEGWDDCVADDCITDIVITGEVSDCLSIHISFLDSMVALGLYDFRKFFFHIDHLSALTSRGGFGAYRSL